MRYWVFSMISASNVFIGTPLLYPLTMSYKSDLYNFPHFEPLEWVIMSILWSRKIIFSEIVTAIIGKLSLRDSLIRLSQVYLPQLDYSSSTIRMIGSRSETHHKTHLRGNPSNHK